MEWGWQCESRGLKHKFIDNCDLIGISGEVCDENEEEDGDDVLQGKTITTTIPPPHHSAGQDGYA